MAGLQPVLDELDRYRQEVGMEPDRILMPVELFTSNMRAIPPQRVGTAGGDGFYIFGARVEFSDHIEARASRIAGFTVEKR